MSLCRMCFAVSTCLMVIAFGFSPAVAQQLNSFPAVFRRLQDEEKANDRESLEELIQEMNTRLEELEFDVKEKLGQSRQAKSSSEKASQSFEDRLESLEDAVGKQGQFLEGVDAQLPGFVTSAHGSPTLQVFGRIHLDWWAFPRAQPGVAALEGRDPEDRVAFRRLRLGVAGDINDNMFYRLEGEVAPGIDPNFRDAFLGFRNSNLFNTIIVGNHKRPYGLDQLNDSNFNIFAERPFVNQAFNEDNRRVGISSNGFNDNKTLNWRYGVWHHGLTDGFSGFISDHYQPEIAGRIAATPWYDDSSGGRGYLHLGLSGSFAWPDGSTTGPDNGSRYRSFGEAVHRNQWLDTGRIFGADTSNLVGLEAVMNVGAFQLSGEYMTVGVNRLDSVGENLRFDGGYVQAAYFLTGEHMPWNREQGVLSRVEPFENFFSVRDCDGNVKRGLGAWQVAVRYSFVDITDQDIIGGQGDAVTFATNWHWNAYARMQFSYVIGEINRPRLTDAGGEYNAVGARFMIDF